MTSTDFGQEVRLTTRLHDLVRSYPRGSSIISEFIQNADDAESSSLTVTLDVCSYTGERLEDQRMVSLLGPALLVHNESVFSDPDFESIKRIGESSKAVSGPKTGRFGVGFNTCYNITDFPSFVSGHFLVCFDPHYTTVAERGKAPGKRWRLSDAWASSPDWLRSFCSAGMKENESYFPGTIFRFPLRTPQQATVSEIWKESFCLDDYSRIVQQLSEDGPQLLLFTKYLTELTALIADGSTKRLLHISTSNRIEVVRARDPLLRSVQLDLKQAISKWKTSRGSLPVCSYEHGFRVATEETERLETWRVVNGLFPGPNGCLLDAAEKMIGIGEKALPLAGAAVRTEPKQLNNVPPKGKVYCGLPLPVASEVAVHLNGYFDLDSSRHALSTGDSVFGQNEYRIAWNKGLMQHGVSAAYARLLMDLRPEFQESKADHFYRLFPPAAQDGSLFSLLSLGLYSHLAQQPVIQTVSHNLKVWRALNAAYDCPVSIREPLVADGKPVIEPSLPFFVVQGFAKNGIALKSFTPKSVADDLRVTKDVNCLVTAAPRKCLSRRDWVTSLLKFCLEDKGCQLKGLPLAFAQDGKLHTFGFTRGGLLFHGTAAHQQIFSSDHDWFVDEQFLKETGVPYQPPSGFRQMTTTDVIARAAEKLRSANRADRINKDGFPDEAWLTATFNCLSSASSGELTANKGALGSIGLVPDASQRLRPLGSSSTPLLRSSQKELAPLIAACERLGVPFVTAGNDLSEAIQQFASTHGNFIWALSPNRIVPLLSKPIVEATSYDSKIHDPLLSYLSRSEILDVLSAQDVSALTDLRILPTQSKSLARAAEPNVFFPPDYHPPRAVRNIRLLYTGPYGSWGKLYDRLGVKHLNRPTLILEVVLPHFATMSESEQLESLEWIRDCFDEEYGHLQKLDAQSARRFRDALAHAPIIICGDGRMHKPSETYDPQESLNSKVLGALAVLPDIKKYQQFPELWAPFFRRLGMAVWPRAIDLLRYIDQLTNSHRADRASAEENLLAVFDFVQKHWERYKEFTVSPTSGTVPFPEALKSRAWLPAVQALKSGPSPAFIQPQPRLYKPSELFGIQQANVVGRIHPLFGKSVEKHVRDAIGMLGRPGPNDVCRQFDELLSAFGAVPNAFSDHRKAASIFNEIYRYFGDVKSTAEDPTSSVVVNQLRSRYKDRECLLDPSELRLWAPDKTFSESVNYLRPLRVQIASTDVRLSAGLDALGRNGAPELRHLVEFLEDFREYFENRRLSATEAEQALRVLYMLPRSGNGNLPQDLPVLTTQSTMVAASETVWQDTERYRDRLSKEAPPTIDPRLLGLATDLRVPRMSEVFSELLADARTQDQSPLSKSYHLLRGRVRSPEFGLGLRRIVRQQYEGDLNATTLAALKNIDLQPCKSIETKIVFTPNQCVVGEGPCTWFYDSAGNTVLIAADTERQVRVALSRAIAILVEPVTITPMQVDAILAVEPREIAGVLDDYDIPQINDFELFISTNVSDQQTVDLAVVGDNSELGVQEEETTAVTASTEEVAAAEPDKASPISQTVVTSAVIGKESEFVVQKKEPASTEGLAPAKVAEASPISEPGVASIVSDKPSAHESEGLEQFSSDDGSVSGDRENLTGKTSSGARSNTQKVSPGYGSDDVPPSTPTFTSPSTEPRRHSAATQQIGGSTKRYQQIVTYVASSKSEAGHGSPPVEDDPENIAISEAAVEYVLQEEIRAKRVPEKMHFTNPGFDVKSCDPVTGEVRFIEVKGTDGSWDKMGVQLTPTQFEFSRTKGSEFWLYVVEDARGEKPLLYCFQDPFSQVDQYRFDGGWKGLADAAMPDRSVQIPHFAVGVKVSLRDSVLGEVRGIVEEIESSGELQRLTIRLSDGTKVKKFLDSTLAVVND